MLTNSKILKIVKRDGSIEPFMPEKWNKWMEWACKDLNVSWSEVAISAMKKLPSEGLIDSEVLQEILISSAKDLIPSNVEYDKVAKELFLTVLRKRIFDSYTPPKLQEIYKWLVDIKLWSPKPWVTKEQFDTLDKVIDHNRDKLFTFGGLEQFCAKYSRRNIVTGDIYETPQVMYMGMCLELLQFPYWSLEEVIKLYDILSLHKANVPTPVLVGLRSGDNGFASCCLVDATDNLDSIDTAEHIVFKMTAARAGIGYHLESRSIADPVKNGAFPHAGKLPYYRHIDRSVKANVQQSRGGSATVQYPFFDPEILSLMSVKAQRTAEEIKIDKMDYSLAFNTLLIKRYLKNESITLMSYFYAPEVHEAFYSEDYSKFEQLYLKAEERLKHETKIGFNNSRMPVAPTILATELLDKWMSIRLETGRLFAHNIEESNRHGVFNDPIRMSNLCQEITQPTKPFNHVTELYQDEETLKAANQDNIGEVSLCNLSGIVLGRIDSEAEWESVTYIIVKFVDTLISMQSYPFPTLKYTANARRNIGIGLINVAGALAKNQLSFEGEKGRNWIHEQTELFSFYLHKASVRLAKELGAAPWFNKTKYSKGILPVDTYKKTVDELVSVPLYLDWEGLRKEILTHGMRNSVLEACMPSESSAVLIGCTNGIEPVRQIVISKSSGANSTIVVAPGAEDWNTFASYELAYNIDQEEWIKFVAVIQKFLGQSISTNMYYDYKKYKNEKIPMVTLIRHFLLSVKYGWKTWYYLNTDVDTGGSSTQGCSSGGCQI